VTARAPRGTDARSRAAEVLAHVEADGAFAAAVLDAALDRGTTLDLRDRALTTTLVYGVLRCTHGLDARIEAHARSGSMRRLDAYTRAVLRVAAYQVLCMARVPSHAAVDAAVDAVRTARSPRLAGFVNAVLRRLAATRSNDPDDVRLRLALASVPEEVRTRVAEVLGADGAARFFAAALVGDGAVTLRTHPWRCDRDALLERVRLERPEATVTKGHVSPLAIHVAGGGDPSLLTVVREGMAGVQEEAAQCVALMAEIAPGDTVLDACAGRGGKSVVAAMALRGQGCLHAVDLHASKLTRLRDELTRLGLAQDIELRTVGADLTRGLGALTRDAPAEGYRVALVDAPCSGIGTLGHRPDLLLRLRDREAWSALADMQLQIVTTVAARVAVGGTLLYAVCTLTHAEGDGVITRFLAAHPSFVLAEGSKALPVRLRASRVVLDTATDGTDGFMAWRLRRHAR
jgi:16S rRNA (cytosine967-C5)-methyltransferase